MTKRIDESNASGIRAVLDILNESVEEVVEAAEETNEEAEEVAEAAEHDLDEKQESKGELYKGETSMPGKADQKIRQVGNTGDNPMACLENDLYKSFLEYLKETEEKEATEEAIEEAADEAVEEEVVEEAADEAVEESSDEDNSEN